MDEKASDELRYRQGHGLVQITIFGAVVLPLEGDLLAVEGDEAAVRDGDPVGVAGEIGERCIFVTCAPAAPAARTGAPRGRELIP